MMSVYIAAPYACKQAAREARTIVESYEFPVISRWLDFEDGGPIETTDPVVLRREAIADVEDVLDADALIVLNLEKSEGKSVETGLMLGRALTAQAIRELYPERQLPIPPILVVGTASNIFHYHPLVTMCDDLDHAIRILKGSL